MMPIEFREDRQYGGYIEILPSCFTSEAVIEAKAILMEQAGDFIPDQHKGKINWIVMGPMPGEVGRMRCATVAWKLGPIKDRP